MKSKPNILSSLLLRWYDGDKQEMPWRDDNNTYHIWLSEIMLQQTQIRTVIPYYYNWLKKFPAISNVANANENEILKTWEGLGYYSRALNFHHACKTIMKKYDGIIPKTAEDFIRLKGVGKYIDAAVRSIGYGHIVPAIDGNVNRVVARLLCLDSYPQRKYSHIYDFLLNIIDKKKPGDFNQAMMDLGRNICKPKNPLCEQCPISTHCMAFQNSTVDNYPIKIKSKKHPHYNVAVGVVWKNNDILITKRKVGGLLGGLWEFPGGKLNKKESAEDCVVREIFEETGLEVELKSFISNIKHQYSHFSISMDAYHCIYKNGIAIPKNSSDLKWITPDEITNFAFPKANHKFMNKIPNTNPWL